MTDRFLYVYVPALPTVTPNAGIGHDSHIVQRDDKYWYFNSLLSFFRAMYTVFGAECRLEELQSESNLIEIGPPRAEIQQF